MSRTKQFSKMDLLEQIEYLVLTKLPKTELTKKTVTIIYTMPLNVVTENNPLELITKDYTVIAVYDSHTIELTIKDGEKVLNRDTILLNETPE